DRLEQRAVAAPVLHLRVADRCEDVAGEKRRRTGESGRSQASGPRHPDEQAHEPRRRPPASLHLPPTQPHRPAAVEATRGCKLSYRLGRRRTPRSASQTPMLPPTTPRTTPAAAEPLSQPQSPVAYTNCTPGIGMVRPSGAETTP